MSRLISLTISILSSLGFNSASGKQKTLLTIGKQGW
jgi:hypothetical protein